MTLLIGFLAVSVATAAWTDSPRYGPDYVGGPQMPSRSNCIPCEERRGGSNSNTLDFRGNGADNLGYDWSPKAWGGPAFPKGERNQPNSDWGGRDGRRMPWDDKCRDCSPGWPGSGMRWDRFTERPDDRSPGWSSSTEQPTDVSTVTSSVLGIRLQDDKRLSVPWGGRSMRWDGFRNGMPWDRPQEPDRMDRRFDNQPWGGSKKGWDQGDYASDWSYGSRDPAGSGTRWNGQRPWTQSWDERKPNDYDQRGGSPPFGSSYPAPSNTYGSSTSTWRPPTSQTKPYYNYPTSSRPEIIKVRPGYGVIDQPNSPAPWNYSPSRPNENYLPQNNRPNDYGRPQGVPGTAIWNGRPDEYRPVQGNKPPNGFYQGFITEIHDPNYNKFPRPENKYPDRPTSDPYNHGSQGGSRYPDRYDRPGQGNSLYPNSRPEGNWDRNPGYDSNRYPNQGFDRYPSKDSDWDRYPNDGNQYGGNRDRYPSIDNDRNKYGGDRDRYPGYDRNPSYNSNPRPQYPDNERYPSDPNRRPSYGYDSDRYPSRPSNTEDRYPSRPSSSDDRYPSRPSSSDDRYPSRPSNTDDRYPSRPSANDDRYPSRPSSSDHDRGPSPGSDQGSWNYGEDGHKDGTYRRSGGSYPSYKGGQYYTSGYLASASTPAASSHEVDKKHHDETTVASTSQEK